MALIRFGASPSSPTPRPPVEQFRLVRRLEEWGFESVWAGDHVSFHNPILESLTLLASYVGITNRIKLGTGVYLLALRSPAVAAKMTATLDVLSGGRLIFGVGVGGENPKEFEVCGVPHKERGARVTEAIDVMRAARQGDGWFSYVVHAERYAQSASRIREEAGRAGRDLNGFANAHLAFVT